MTEQTAKKATDGYRGPGLAVLHRHGVGVWSDVEVQTTGRRFRGIVNPR